MSNALRILPGDFQDARVKALLAYHLRGMHENSPPGHVFALDWSGLQKPGITLYAGFDGERLVVMGALKDLGDGTGEIKSMRVAEGEAGKGYGRAMLEHLVAEARRRGYCRLSLETGTGEPFAAAHRLYKASGFAEGGEFGGYTKSDFNVLMHLELDAS